MSNVNSQLKNKANDFEWFSLTLVARVDISFQHCSVIWGDSAKLEITEELAFITGKNIFKIEKTNLVQPEVESVKMCYNKW